MMEHGRRTRNHKLQRGPGGVPSLVTPLPHGQTLLCTPHPGFCFSKAGRTPKGAFFPPISASHSHGGRAGLSSPSPAPAWVILMDPRSTTRFIIPWGGNAPSIPIPPPCANASRFGSIRPRFLQGGFDTPCQRRVHHPRELSLLLFLWLIRPTKPCLKKISVCLVLASGATITRAPVGKTASPKYGRPGFLQCRKTEQTLFAIPGFS